MKQKIVIKVQMHCPKCRSKALKIAAAAPGVSSVALEGKERDQVVVTGEQIDVAALTCLMRKKVGFASLESVQEVKEKAESKDGGTAPKPTPAKENQNPCHLHIYGSQPPCHLQTYEVVYDTNPPGCTIL